MPRKPADTIQILRKRVTEVISRATAPSAEINSKSNDLVNSFQQVQKGLEKMEVLFPKFKLCEEDLRKESNLLEQDIHDEVFDDGNNLTHDDTIIGKKLDSINKTLEKIDSLVTEIHFPATEEKPDRRRDRRDPSSEDEAPEVSKDWMVLGLEENILVSPAMANLQLSYDVLDIRLKLCLLCFAIFPEKAVIKKRPLIYWWIAEGFVTKSKEKKTAEEVGEGIFKEFIKRGLIEPFHYKKNKKSPIVDSCKIHPWIRRMLISVAKRAEFFDFNDSGEFVNDCSKSRRACLALGNKGFSGYNNEQEGGGQRVVDHVQCG
uniref:Disease resistance protein winged helix domain-containing protein n=1 Tax=Davidia involucrata TaxID=16924 RepID=A0A5B6Z1K7_DAVIN